MDRKEILKSSFDKTKNFFWIYLAVAAVSAIIGGIGDGAAETFGMLSRFVASLRSGLFSYENIADKSSDFWELMLSGNGLLQNSGLVGMAVTIFLVNPLEIGEAGVFLNDAPKFDMLWNVFGKGYRKTVKTTFVYNFLMTLIVSAVTTVYFVAAFAGVGVFAIAAHYTNIGAAAVVAIVLYVLVLSALYTVVTVSISYDFSMVPYIISENCDCTFTAAYAKSRQAVRGRKMKIFSVDFVFCLLMALSVMIPIIFISVGIALKLTGMGGISSIIVGIFSIVPVLCFNVFVSVFRKSAWAKIYIELKEEKEPSPVIYAAPEVEENISYGETNENE